MLTLPEPVNFTVSTSAFVGTVSLGHATSDSAGHWTLAWPTRATGAYEVTVIATDAAGNTTRLTETLGQK